MKKILLIEDDQFIRDIYVGILSPVYKVDIDKDGEFAYEKIIKKDYDLILIDIFLPKSDGRKIFKRLQKNFPEKYREKIVFVTNDDSDETISFFKDSRVNYIIKSSLNTEQFFDKINSLITK
ncbi:Response regulator receiver domain protein [Candidatus Roizmanbacteria bacterium]|nr:Response regulator receiver domain protein [Candidatus Roizmanbacteria bacterium]